MNKNQIKIKRDTTKDLFNATLQLVKDNGHYDKAAVIMDYYLPNEHENNIREDIELSSYEFDFNSTAQFGSSEGIYIDCYLSGKYTENEIKVYNHNTGTVETEKRRHIGTFKTLRTDLESMKIMGELCGALVFYASQYVNANIDRYSTTKELEWQARYKQADLARRQYISKLSENMTSAGECESCDKKSCRGKQDGCNKGIVRFIIKEVGKHCSMTRYATDKRNPYFNFMDGKYNADKDCFDEYVNILTGAFPDLIIYQVIAYVFVWLCTRKQDFIFELSKNINCTEQ